MKKLLCLFLALATGFCLFACHKEKTINTTATEADIAHLEAMYDGLQVYHGQLHDHSDSGRRSDGAAALSVWKEYMPYFGMDFAAILDHRQTDHMYHEDWDASLFISGTEAMTYVMDRTRGYNKYHYNMIVRNVADMEEIMANHQEVYGLEDGIFRYRGMGSEEFTQIIQEVQAAGGFFVLAHPGQTTGSVSEDPLEYYYCDYVGYEVLYHLYSDLGTQGAQSQINYNIYTGLLAAGKKVYATAGSDVHDYPVDRGLTTVYAAQAMDTSYLDQISRGNFTAGAVGVRMVIGDTIMGGTGDFAGQRVVISVGDFHMNHTEGTFQLKVFTDQGEVLSVDISSGETNYIAFDADENAKFYRVEIHNTDQEYTLFAMGNPIWNN